MSKTHLIIYATNHFATRRIFWESFLKTTDWVDEYRIYSDKDLSENFKTKYQHILTQPRGGGYWLWKMEIIRQRLAEIKEGDFLFYVDAGCTPNFVPSARARFETYLEMCREHSMVRFAVTHKEYKWSNAKLLRHFKKNYPLTREDVESNQIMATVMIMKKDARTQKFVDTFFEVIDADPLLITDVYNHLDPSDGFQDHRHDQSISSLVTKVTKIGKVIPDETYFEDWSWSKHYPFWATRST